MINPQPCILVIDDDQEDHLILADSINSLDPLQPLHFEVDGIEGWQKLDQLHSNGQEVSLLIIDLNMPKMGGIEFLRRAKADSRFKDIPCIVYSTSVNPIEKELAIQLGAESYITKPLSMTESKETAKFFLHVSKREKKI